jgi:hypothetical protein
MRPIMQGGITRHYVAEWESVLRELSALKAGWARVLDFDDRALRSDPAGELIARRGPRRAAPRRCRRSTTAGVDLKVVQP